MDDKTVEIEGRVYDLSDPQQKKEAVRAWLRAKARGREQAGAWTEVSGIAEERPPEESGNTPDDARKE